MCAEFGFCPAVSGAQEVTVLVLTRAHTTVVLVAVCCCICVHAVCIPCFCCLVVFTLVATNSFSRDQLSLVDRGWTVGIAHIRGGGDMGRRWYEVRAFGQSSSVNDSVIVSMTV